MQPVNDGCDSFDGALHATLTGRAGVARGVFNMKNLRVTITLKIDVAACLYGLAAIIALLT